MPPATVSSLLILHQYELPCTNDGLHAWHQRQGTCLLGMSEVLQIEAIDRLRRSSRSGSEQRLIGGVRARILSQIPASQSRSYSSHKSVNGERCPHNSCFSICSTTSFGSSSMRYPVVFRLAWARCSATASDTWANLVGSFFFLSKKVCLSANRLEKSSVHRKRNHHSMPFSRSYSDRRCQDAFSPA